MATLITEPRRINVNPRDSVAEALELIDPLMEQIADILLERAGYGPLNDMEIRFPRLAWDSERTILWRRDR
jgi:hypothetical protein